MSAGNVDRYEEDYRRRVRPRPDRGSGSGLERAHCRRPHRTHRDADRSELRGLDRLGRWATSRPIAERLCRSAAGLAASPTSAWRAGNVLFDGASDFHERIRCCRCDHDNRTTLLLGRPTRRAPRPRRRASCALRGDVPVSGPRPFKGSADPLGRVDADRCAPRIRRLRPSRREASVCSRRYGWGVPAGGGGPDRRRTRSRWSIRTSSCLFDGRDYRARVFRSTGFRGPPRPCRSWAQADVTLRSRSRTSSSPLPLAAAGASRAATPHMACDSSSRARPRR